MKVPEIDVTITQKSRWGRPILRLNKPVRYSLRIEFVRLAVRVPKGFETDLASIPFFLWWLLSPWGPWRYAAIIHDYLCGVEGVPRFLADAVFRHVMAETDEVTVLQRVVIYYAVRLYWVIWGQWFS